MNERRLGELSVREWGDPAEAGIVLWPGLGATASYFAAIADSLPGRAVAVDPPGFGHSGPIDTNRRERYVELALDAIEASDSRAMVGHSLGAYLAADVATEPSPALRAVVLIDGGFLTANELGQAGMPVGEGRAALTAWFEANEPRFSDWDSAVSDLSRMFGTEPSPVMTAYVHDIFGERDGQLRRAASPQLLADLVLAIMNDDAGTPRAGVKVPTLLIACGQPAALRSTRQAAWERFAATSPLIEVHVAEEWSHNPTLQAPKALAELIGHWLEEQW